MQFLNHYTQINLIIFRKVFKYKITTVCMEKRKSNLLKSIIAAGGIASVLIPATVAGTNYIDVNRNLNMGGYEVDMHFTRDGMFTKKGIMTNSDQQCKGITFASGVPFLFGIFPAGHFGYDLNGDGKLDAIYSNVRLSELPNLESRIPETEIPREVQQAYADLRESRGLNEYCNR